jgi:hypothetical protein
VPGLTADRVLTPGRVNASTRLSLGRGFWVAERRGEVGRRRSRGLGSSRRGVDEGCGADAADAWHASQNTDWDDEGSPDWDALAEESAMLAAYEAGRLPL